NRDGAGPRRDDRGDRPKWQDRDSAGPRRDDRGDRPKWQSRDGGGPRRDDRGDRPNWQNRDSAGPRRDDRGDRSKWQNRSGGGAGRPGDRSDRPKWQSRDGGGPRRDDRGERPNWQNRDSAGPRRDDRGERPKWQDGDSAGPRRDERGDRPRWQEREGSGPGEDRSERPRSQEHGGREDRPRRREPERELEPRDTGPALPEEAELGALDPEARRELSGLSKAVAEIVGTHLVAAGLLVDEEPERALEHARYARSRASRVAIVREAAGLTAYHAGEWAEALAELRAARRMGGSNAHLAVMADCERALGRPERALELAAEAGADVPAGTAVELRIVSSGARRDMGQLDAAVVGLQGPDLDAARRDPWSARLFYAYADNLAAAGRVEDAIRWFLNAAEADDDELTDAAERAVELGASLDPDHSPAGTPEPENAVEPAAADE
ncbi:MAG TPA: hypothetical protein VFO68_03640, partial [Actinophytocola sp.]|nr:hypothetical protein [Actinophytocola sp.]